MSHILTALRSGIDRLFTKHLLITNTVSCGVFLGLGDYIVQKIECQKCLKEGNVKRHDWKRTGRMCAVGLMLGPPNMLWYNMLDNFLPAATKIVVLQKILLDQIVSSPVNFALFIFGRMFTMGILTGPLNHAWYTFLDKLLAGRAVAQIGPKILLDQICASPFFAFTFFMGMGTLEGEPLKNSLAEFKSKFWTVYAADWCVWPLAQSINFYYLPTRYRVVYVSMITLGWDVFLSYVKHEYKMEDSTTLTEKATQEQLQTSAETKLQELSN